MSRHSNFIILVVTLIILFLLKAEMITASININYMALAVLRLSKGLDILVWTCEPIEIIDDGEQSSIDDLLAHLQFRRDENIGSSTRVANLLQAAMLLNRSLYLKEIQELAPLAGQFGEFRLGLVKFLRGDVNGAAQIWKTLGADSYPLGAGNLCRNLGRDDTASKWFQLAAEMNSVKGRALFEAGLIEYSKGAFDMAGKWFFEALNHGYRTAMVYEYLGAALIKDGQADYALQILEQGVLQYPESLDLWLWYAESQYQVGRVEQSIFSYQKALVIDEDNIYAHIGLGKAYLRNGNTAAALVEVRTCLNLIEKLDQSQMCDPIMDLVITLSDATTSLRAARTCDK